MERETGLEPATSSLGSWHSTTSEIAVLPINPPSPKNHRGLVMTKTIEELRKSSYHQQLGRKMCAAFIAQQQGIALDTAFKKVPDPVADCWLVVAEFARDAAMKSTGLNFDELVPRRTGFII
jgi:hypothetical protein